MASMLKPVGGFPGTARDLSQWDKSGRCTRVPFIPTIRDGFQQYFKLGFVIGFAE